MKSLDKAAIARIVWLAVAFVVFGVGVGLVWWPTSQSIDQVRSHARELYEEANQNDAIVRRAADLRAAQKRIHDDLQQLGGERSPGAVTAAALSLLSAEGKRMNVDVRSIAPAPAAAQSAAVHESLSGSDVAIGVRGPFKNVMNLIADLPRHNVLVEVHDAQITSSDITKKAPVLDVTINATIFRVSGNPEGKRV